MGDTHNIFGFELLQKLYDTQLQKKEDVIILLVHWFFIKRGFRCIGIGDSKAFDVSETGSELLPEGWNTRPNYALRYVQDQKLYIFHATRSDEDLLLNLLRVSDQTVSNVQFPINQTVTALHGPLNSLIPSYQTVLSSLRTDLFEPIAPGNTSQTSTQTTAENREREIPTIYERQRVTHYDPIDRWPSPESPSNVGAADLNPFARGGGMIYDPFAPPDRHATDPRRPGIGIPGRLPPGAIPPFARFDPFGPPDVNQPRPRRDPDNDHLPPTGYDDMFM